MYVELKKSSKADGERKERELAMMEQEAALKQQEVALKQQEVAHLRAEVRCLLDQLASSRAMVEQLRLEKLGCEWPAAGWTRQSRPPAAACAVQGEQQMEPQQAPPLRIACTPAQRLQLPHQPARHHSR